MFQDVNTMLNDLNDHYEQENNDQNRRLNDDEDINMDFDKEAIDVSYLLPNEEVKPEPKDRKEPRLKQSSTAKKHNFQFKKQGDFDFGNDPNLKLDLDSEDERLNLFEQDFILKQK